MKLGTYLLVGFTIVAVLPALLLTGINELSIRIRAQEELSHFSRAIAMSAAESVSAILRPVLYELQDIARFLDDRRVDAAPESLASVRLHDRSSIESLLILDDQGNSVFSLPSNPERLGRNFGTSDLFNVPRLTGGVCFSDSFLSFQTRVSTTAVSAASKSGYVAVLNLNLEWISGLVRDATQELGATVRLVDGQGVVIAAPDSRETVERASFKDVLKAGAAAGWSDMHGIRYVRGNKAYLAYSSPVRGSPWRTLVSFQEKDVDSLPNFIRSQVILGGCISILLSFLAAYFISRGLRRSLDELLAYVHDISLEIYPDDRQLRSPFSETDELLREFSNMQKEVCLREEELKGALATREMLLKEVHHRVKNNLQIVASLLALQRERIENPEAYAALAESAQRVHSLAMVHEKLYQSSDFSTLDLGEYIQDFSQGLLGAFDAARNFDLEINVESVDTDIDTAIPIGLCVNEILSNSVKYGRKTDADRGTIRLNLKKEETGFLLTISDDGPGFDPEVARKSGSLGLLLIDSLVLQIKGTLTLDTSAGSRFEIRVTRLKSQS